MAGSGTPGDGGPNRAPTDSPVATVGDVPVPSTSTGRATDGSRPPLRPGSSRSPRTGAAPTVTELGPAVLLLVAGVLIGIAAVVGVATAADGGPRGGVPVAAFTAALPGLVAVVVGLRAPTAGLALTAAAGWWGLARLLADLSLLGDLSTVVRPELFAETSARSQPFTVGAGVGALLLADLIWIVAAVLATRAVATRLLPDRPAGSALFGDPAPDGAAADRDGRTRWSVPVLLVGLLGVVLVAVGSLDPGYVGGFLDLRALPPGATLLGILGIGLAVIVAAGLVLVAGATRRSVAVPLLLGSGLAAAVPLLVAIIVVAGGDGIGSPELSGLVWWGLAGAVLLAVAGLLAPRGDGPAASAPQAHAGAASAGAPGPVPTEVPDGHRAAFLAGGLALLAGAASIGAAFTPLLLIDGKVPVGATADVVAPIGPPFAVAAAPVLLAGVLVLLAPTRRAGLIAAAVTWAGPLLALTQALAVRATVLFSASRPVDSPQQVAPPTWTDGLGFWSAWLAVLAALTAAVLAAIAARRLSDAATDVPDDDSVAASRPLRTGLAVGLSALTVVALSVPIWSTLGQGASSTLLSGYDVGVWGRWAVAVAVVIAVGAAARTLRADVALAAPIAAAAVTVQPLLVPAAVREQVGFTWGAGSWLVGAVAVLLLAAAPVFARQAARIRVGRR